MSDPRTIPIPRHLKLAASAALAAALAAGCGGVALHAPGSREEPAAAVKSQWLRCMSQHGVTIPQGSAAGLATAEPGYTAAYAACLPILAKAPAPAGQAQANQQFLAGLLRYARCMRAHGIPVPDPMAGGGGTSGGVQQPQIGSAISTSDPRFQTAQNACRAYLPSGGSDSLPPGGAS